MDMNRLTMKAQEALGEAQNLALMRNHQEVDVEHLALALLRQKDGLVPGILGRMDVRAEVVAAELEQALDKKPSVTGSGVDQQAIRITQRLARALAQSEELARRLKDEYISVEHIFAQLIDDVHFCHRFTFRLSFEDYTTNSRDRQQNNACCALVRAGKGKYA